METCHFNLDVVHPSWKIPIEEGLSKLDSSYLNTLYKTQDWLPGPEKIFNAFTLPLSNVNYVLFGESPYPRIQSANGYAFWDNSVKEIWSPTGLSKEVNRATSLRNILKMLLIAEGKISPHELSQENIAHINKDTLIKTNHELFNNLLSHGFLLLNATPVLRPTLVKKDALSWHPFVKHILHILLQTRPHTQLILFGQIANTISQLIDLSKINSLCAEHPYNLSFIKNKTVLDFFRPFHLLKRKNQES